MKTVSRSILVLLVLSSLFLAAPALLAAENQTLEGEFIWEREDGEYAGELKAVFEPTGESTWNVSFYFNFDDKDHVYSGTAEGNLTDGELTGEVMSDDEEKHPYTFSGTFDDDGSFAGTHQFLGGEEARDTGRITLSR